MAHRSSEKGVVTVYTESLNLIPTGLQKARRFCSICREAFINTGKPRDGKGDRPLSEIHRKETLILLRSLSK